jgi:iron complex outermembrane receptor protein
MRGGVCCIVAGGILAAPCWAQLPELETVVVTAQKREQSLQEVPIAVSAFSGGDLLDAHVADVTDLNQIAPSLQRKDRIDLHASGIRARVQLLTRANEPD